MKQYHSLYSTAAISASHLNDHNILTAFHGASVQLKPGAYIITSRLYWSSAGYPKKLETIIGYV
jgi:hypothetical protein